MTEIQDYLLGLETGSLSILPAVDGGQKLPKVMALFESVTDQLWMYWNQLIDTFRFEDKNKYEYEIWFKVFSLTLKKKKTGNVSSTIFYTRIALLSLLEKVKPSLDRKMIKLLTLIWWLVSSTTAFSLKPVVEWRLLSRFPSKMTLFHAQALLSIRRKSRPHLRI